MVEFVLEMKWVILYYVGMGLLVVWGFRVVEELISKIVKGISDGRKEKRVVLEIDDETKSLLKKLTERGNDDRHDSRQYSFDGTVEGTFGPSKPNDRFC